MEYDSVGSYVPPGIHPGNGRGPFVQPGANTGPQNGMKCFLQYVNTIYTNSSYHNSSSALCSPDPELDSSTDSELLVVVVSASSLSPFCRDFFATADVSI